MHVQLQFPALNLYSDIHTRGLIVEVTCGLFFFFTYSFKYIFFDPFSNVTHLGPQSQKSDEQMHMVKFHILLTQHSKDSRIRDLHIHSYKNES